MIPLERFPSLARLARCRISQTETNHGDEEKKTSEAGTEFARNETQCRRDRCGSDGDLRGRARRSGHRFRAIVSDLYTGRSRGGRLAATIPARDWWRGSPPCLP